MSEAREARLPVWVQAELARLRADVIYWEKKATDSSYDETNTRVNVGPLAYRNLEPSARIEFLLGPGRSDGWRRDALEVRVADGRLYIQGEDTLDVRPQASNCLTIGVVAR